jgi:tRNA threonylcarbamoyladenosine biosynthesis protein TsaE
VTAPTPSRFVVPTPEAMRELSARIGRACRGGDVLVLTGDLGAGKTTFTQGLARGMGIAEAVTSPTFVIARVHVNPGSGPDLVHVDAYRLGSVVEMDDLDLDADLDRSVVVVEWGGGLAGGLSDDPLEIVIERPDEIGDETRVLSVSAGGARWPDALAAIAGDWGTP